MNNKLDSRRKLLQRVINFWVPVIIWASLIFSFSTTPTKPVSQILWRDFIVKKSAHIIEYAILTTLLYRALKESGVEKKEAGFYSIILSVLYGLSDEFHQSFTPGREPKIRDVFFDTIGSVTSIFVLWNLLPKAPEELKKLAKSLQLL